MSKVYGTEFVWSNKCPSCKGSGKVNYTPPFPNVGNRVEVYRCPTCRGYGKRFIKTNADGPFWLWKYNLFVLRRRLALRIKSFVDSMFERIWPSP